MSYSAPYLISDSPPAEALAELDAAARALDTLLARAAQLTLNVDEQTAVSGSTSKTATNRGS